MHLARGGRRPHAARTGHVRPCSGKRLARAGGSPGCGPGRGTHRDPRCHPTAEGRVGPAAPRAPHRLSATSRIGARSKRGSHNTRVDAARKMAIEYGRWHIRKIPVPTVAKMNQQAVNTTWERPPTGGADGAILPSNLSGTTDRVEEAALKLGHARVRRQRGRP